MRNAPSAATLAPAKIPMKKPLLAFGYDECIFLADLKVSPTKILGDAKKKDLLSESPFVIYFVYGYGQG
jgi:hypothetical protein